MISPYLDEQPKFKKEEQSIINIRNLKTFFYLGLALPPYDIENLIEYLDKDNNGFVGVNDLQKEIEFK